MQAIEPARSLVEKTYDALLDAICTGQFKPGARLAQDELAARLQVSRQPVNSAIALLKTQGFVQDTGRRGVTVAPVGPDMLREIYEFRSAVDPLAVRLAVPRLSQDAILRGRAIIEAGKQAIAQGSAPLAIQADMDFHGLIYELSGNGMLGASMRLNWRHLQRGMRDVLSNPGMTIAVWKEHEAIFRDMSRGDAESAAARMHAHVTNALERTLNEQAS